MGLSLSVGYLADVAEADPEGAARVRQDFARLNEFLGSKKLPPHHEPEEITPFSCQMYGYGGLHYLRRIAAHLAQRGTLPPPGDDKASKDHVLAACYADDPLERGWLRQWLGRARSGQRFDHLIHHSDAEGYYLPRDFSQVLIASPDEWEIPGGWIGSAVRLRVECEALAGALELPLDLDAESEEVWAAPDSQGEGDVKWKRYGIESFTCLRLHFAATHALKTGAALVFC